MSTQHWLFNIRIRLSILITYAPSPRAFVAHKSHKVVDTVSLCRRPLMLLLSRFCYLNIVTVWSRWAISESQQKAHFLVATRNIILLEKKNIKKILALSSNINGEKCHRKTWRLMIDRYFQTLFFGWYLLPESWNSVGRFSCGPLWSRRTLQPRLRPCLCVVVVFRFSEVFKWGQ